MAFFNKYPFTDFHELNADWIIKKVIEMGSTVEELETLVNSYETRVATLETKMTTAEGNIASLQAAATNAANRIAALEGADIQDAAVLSDIVVDNFKQEITLKRPFAQINVGTADIQAAELAGLDDEEKAMFLEDLGLKESGLEKLVKASYSLLGLISYLTAGKQETRAWTITRGTKAPQAAGKIHTDFERGFIRAEVVNYQDLLDCGSYAAAKDKGLVRLEGKEYVVQDGDVVLFRFNV